MADATATENLQLLFEPLCSEIMTEQSQRYPTENPVPPERRREIIDWLTTQGGVSIKLFEPYNNPDVRDVVIDGMLLNSWFLPDQELANKLPLRGQSTRIIGSTSIPMIVPGETRKVDVVVKPCVKKNKALYELENLQKAIDRGIPAIKPLGILEIADTLGRDIYILTILRKGIVPLEKLNFEQLHLSPNGKYEQLTELLESLGAFIAEMHNKGIVHGDLHLGNIAVDLDQDAQFVVFDLERARILNSDKLYMKDRIDRRYKTKLMTGFSDFERGTVEDLARVSGEIVGRNEHINIQLILDHLVEAYLNKRQPTHGQMPREQFLELFNNLESERSRKVRHMVEWTRKNRPELSE